MINKQSHLDLVASKLLADAVVSQFPGVVVLHAQADTYGFSCTFRTKQPIHVEMLSFLEQSIKTTLKSSQVKSFEMVRDVAVNYLIHKGNKTSAQQIKECAPGQLLTILELPSYVDAVEEEIDLEAVLAKLQCVKLLEIEDVKTLEALHRMHQYLVKGISAEDPQSLKVSVKQIKEAKASYHVEVLKKQGMLASTSHGAIITLSKAVAYRQRVCDQLKMLIEAQGFQEICLHQQYDEKDLHDLMVSEPPILPKQVFFFDWNNTSLDSQEKELGLYSLETSLALTMLQKFTGQPDPQVLENVIGMIDGLFRTWELSYVLSFSSYMEKEKKQIASRDVLESCLKQRKLDHHIQSELSDPKMKGEECQLVFSVQDSFGRNWDLITAQIHGKKGRFHLEVQLISLDRLVALFQDVNKVFSKT